MPIRADDICGADSQVRVLAERANFPMVWDGKICFHEATIAGARRIQNHPPFISSNAITATAAFLRLARNLQSLHLEA
eukprot:CAMPEP_0170153596 /NCGR_PEP_ID=MMETSP0033_2-20121228/55731_1 /TAXON_ID=195969 /ORGANISM="Dolichomastix tenuilepis, Strain CCMP3274" /LENGTH=77 /DNA_ID=CAMNT_0010390805 /DNA_START=83 /DNA_END=313 /DNA_ORIENTATION=+